MARTSYTHIQSIWDAISLYGTDGHNILWAYGFVRFVYGHKGNDVLVANQNGDSYLYGGWDHDTLISMSGADRLDGGPGNDTASYQYSTAAVHVDLFYKTASGGYAEGDTLVDIENLRGSDHDDTLVGNNYANTIIGGDGNDVISGFSGNDVIWGSGNGGGPYGDIMTGGAMDDTFKFLLGSDSSNAAGRDVITDFNQMGDDTIEFYLGSNDHTVKFSGEASNFSVAASEIWYQKTFDGTWGNVTIVHAQFKLSEDTPFYYADVILDGHMDVTADDFAFGG